MKHTKLTIRGRGHSGQFYVIADEKTQGESFYEEIRTLERAKRFVKCWNCHDDLLEACKKALKQIALSISARKVIEQAVAKAKESEV